MRKAPQKRPYKYSLLLALFVIMALGGCIYALAKSDVFKSSSHDNLSSAVKSGVPHYPELEKAVLPQGTPSIETDYTGFFVSFNPDNRTPNYVGWELLASETDGPNSRTNRFWTDNAIKGCPDTRDYTRSGYDRGHICPAADMKWSAEAMEDCFSMANICPQVHSLNAGAWKTLEEKERIWAQRDSALVIIAGPIYQKGDRQTIGENKVRVPSAFFKAIIAPYLADPRGIAFVYPNDYAPGNMQNYVQTIDYVEELTGLDLFYNLPDEIENKIENQSSFRAWNRR